MPTFYNFKQDGNTYSFDDVFIPADAFRQGNLWVWGNNNGYLGTNDGTNRSTPVTTFAGGTNWKQVSRTSNHTAAIKTDGTLWTWGNNGAGALGTNGGATNVPVQVFGNHTNWKQVSCGILETAAIKTDGTLWTWGRNPFGGLGVNDTTRRETPVTTFAGGTNWKQITTGYNYITAIKTDGTLWTWGMNGNGKLGVNDTTNRATPVTTFAGGTNWKSVGDSINFSSISIAIKTDGTLWTWGNNGSGQLGTNGGGDRYTPVTTFAGGTNWKQSSGGANHTAAIKTDGTLWVWGNNPEGQLGVNDTTNRATPVTTFAGGTNWKQVSCEQSGPAAIEYIDPVL
jgi:alpha-tubulin suppressor-like RCC1 family protein